MKISTKGRYAVRAMIDLATNSKDQPVPLSQISERQGISLNYLEQLFVRLRRSGLVKSVRGPGGGYFVAKSPGEISIKDVLLAAEENMHIVECLKYEDDGFCDQYKFDECVTRMIWKRLGDQILKAMGDISIQDLCEEKAKIENRLKQDCIVKL